MSGRPAPRVLSVPPGAPFLPTLAEAFMTGALVPAFRFDGDPLAMADATIYVPTRRAARELRSVFVERAGGRAAILPRIRPLGEFDEDAAAFEPEGADVLDLAPPIAAQERILMLAPLVQAWKRRVPAHVAALYEEGVVVPASAADAIWLARDLAALIDEGETEGSDWSKLSGLVADDLAGWWQVTLDFLRIVTAAWPAALAERGCSNPAAHRNALILAEAERLRRNPPPGPVVAAGSTGSIPATATLLAAVARLDKGAVVLPGLDGELDERAWAAIGAAEDPAGFGHPQFGLKTLLAALGIARSEVPQIGARPPARAARARLVGEALRPAETTDDWAERRPLAETAVAAGALDGVALVEAANEREEALAIAVALRRAIAAEGASAALVTPDRALARRVAAELGRFGIEADDSGGRPLAQGLGAGLMRLLLEAVFRPGDPVAAIGLLKHPLLRLGRPAETVRRAAGAVELVALRGGTGRPDAADLAPLLESRLAALAAGRRPPWFERLTAATLAEARALVAALTGALAPLAALRAQESVELAAILRVTVETLEALAATPDGRRAGLYEGDFGEALAGFLRGLVDCRTPLAFRPAEWPDILAALIAGETVKPPVGADPRIAIWGTLEARLQSVDTLVLGGLNEGTWPRQVEADRFLSRLMKGGLDLEPPERRIGQAAHDFVMAMGAPAVVLTRAARAGDAPAVASRWLQRLTAFAGERATAAMRERGAAIAGAAHALERVAPVDYAPRPQPTPPLAARPTRFSVTEVETLRRDPYAVYARRILGLQPLEPLIRDPGAAERGTLFHAILQRFMQAGTDPAAPDALDALLAAGRAAFAEAALPADVEAVWWPRFARTAEGVIAWERGRAAAIATRIAEARAAPFATAAGPTLSGYADRIDLRTDGAAEIIDFKTGAGPSKVQAHTLVAPQLALEGALLARGAFADIGPREPAELAYVRLRANGTVGQESVLEHNRRTRSAADLSQEAWERLERLFAHYGRAEAGYLSRALPFREGDTEGDYDHLARVLEWSAGADRDGDSGGGEP